MADDRELLELVAQAVGGTLSEGIGKRRTGETWAEWEWYGPLGIHMPDGCVAYPLTDNGHAFEVAVMLGMEVYHADDGGWSAYASHPTARGIAYAIEPHGSDPCAATRRAIVRAAAAYTTHQADKDKQT